MLTKLSLYKPFAQLSLALENIVNHPLRATFTVGSSIISLLLGLRWLGHYYPALVFLQYLIPFIPPFIITTTAKRIHARALEQNFIIHAAPYIFVAYPKEASLDAFLEARPLLLSHSSSEQLNCPYEELTKLPTLAQEFVDQNVSRHIILELLTQLKETPSKAVIKDIILKLKPRGQTAQPYLLCSTLVKEQDRLRWQATLVRLYSEPGAQKSSLAQQINAF